MSEPNFNPPYIYCGLYDHEQLMSRPLLDAHVRDYKRLPEERLQAINAELAAMPGTHIPVYGLRETESLSRSLGLANITATGEAVAQQQEAARFYTAFAARGIEDRKARIVYGLLQGASAFMLRSNRRM